MVELAQAETVYDALGDVLARWTMGVPAAPVVTIWRGEIGEETDEAELRLLALSGHFLSVSVTAEPASALRTLADIPKLALPPLPDPLRPLACRILRGTKDTHLHRCLLTFLARRGWTMHPDDWMPAAGDAFVPDVYAPWRDWAHASAAGRPLSRGATDELKAETWSAFGPATRLIALAALRHRDPAAAAALIREKIGGEDAETRLRLLGVLASALSRADADLLEGLAAADRAPKVKTLASSLLARIAQGDAGRVDASELASFFEIGTKGLLRRRRIIRARPLKSPAQHHRRRQLFSLVEFAGFAAALNLAPSELATTWTWQDDADGDVQFAEMLERTGPDTLIADAFEQLRDLDGTAIPAILALQSRLDVSQRADVARRQLQHGAPFQSLLRITQGDCEIDVSMQSSAASAVFDAVAGDASRSEADADLRALGLLTTGEAAERAIERLQTMGVLVVDPRLDALRLNTALPKGTDE